MCPKAVYRCPSRPESAPESNPLPKIRVATSHGNHGKVMELFLVMEKVMEFQKPYE